MNVPGMFAFHSFSGEIRQSISLSEDMEVTLFRLYPGVELCVLSGSLVRISQITLIRKMTAEWIREV